MTLREALNYFDLDYSIKDNKIMVYDTTGYFTDYTDLCSTPAEALNYGLRDSILNDYFFNDSECIVSQFPGWGFDEIYDYLESNSIPSSYKEIIGAISGRVPVTI